MNPNDMTPKDYLDMIFKELDGIEWDSDTLENIAAIIGDAGYVIRDSDDMPDEVDG